MLDLPKCMAKSVIHVKKKVRIHGANKVLLEITLLRSTPTLGHRSIAYSSFDPKLPNFIQFLPLRLWPFPLRMMKRFWNLFVSN